MRQEPSVRNRARSALAFARRREGFPAWAAVLAMAAFSVLVHWRGGSTVGSDGGWETGVALAGVIAIAWLCARISVEVFFILGGVGTVLGWVMEWMGAGLPVTLSVGLACQAGMAYLVADSPRTRNDDGGEVGERVSA